VTPVLAAQLDDPHCLRELHTWLGLWQARAEDLAARADPHLRAVASYEFSRATQVRERFETVWRHGASPVLRRLADAGAVELLGGPATHPFLPLLQPRVADYALRVGLDDALVRTGRRPGGIWSPECGYAPGLERAFARRDVSHFLVDETTLAAAGRPTSSAWEVAGSGVVAFARDLAVTNLIWSARSGYPTGAAYRDFHARDATGFRLLRVTGPEVPAEHKAPYDPAAASAAVERDARAFVDGVRRRLAGIAAAQGRPGLVVAAYDTELFGHWWHEGPAFLDAVLRLLPSAGVRTTTLEGALEAGLVGGGVDLGPGSWGAGKDFSVWAGPAVADLVTGNDAVQRRLLSLLDATGAGALRTRRADLDQLAREALLRLSSDWAFMVTRNSAAAYARSRAEEHARRFDLLASVVEGGGAHAQVLAQDLRRLDGPFGALDARLLAVHAG
jgi:1,4-alpha-glucan branching enzyme